MDENINNTEESTPMMASASTFAAAPVPTYQELVDRAAEIREETEKGANTAERVGSWMEGVLAWANAEINSLKGMSNRIFYATRFNGSAGSSTGSAKMYIYVPIDLPVFENYPISTRMLVRSGSVNTHDIEISVAKADGKYGVKQLVGAVAGVKVYGDTANPNRCHVVVKFAYPDMSYIVYTTQSVKQIVTATWTDANPDPQEKASWVLLTQQTTD